MIILFCQNIVVALILQYSQTWANDHLRITTTCLQRPLVYNDHYCGVPFFTFRAQKNLWTTTTWQQRPQFWGPVGGRCTQVWLYFCKSFLSLDQIINEKGMYFFVSINQMANLLCSLFFRFHIRSSFSVWQKYSK